MTDTPERDVGPVTANYALKGAADSILRLQAEITSLRAQLREARAKAFEELAAFADQRAKEWYATRAAMIAQHRAIFAQARAEEAEFLSKEFRSRAQQQIGAETKP